MKSLLFFLFQLSICINACGEIFSSDARDMAMSNSSVAALPSYGFSKNMAFIPAQKKSYITMTVFNKYLLKDLSPVFLNYVKSFNKFSISTGIGRTGNDNFSEQMLEAGIAKKLGEKFYAGIKIEYHRWILSDANYPQNHVLIPSAGIYTNPLKNLSLGVIIRDPVRSRMSAIETTKLPALLNPGLSLKVSEKIIVATSVIQQSSKPLSTQFGLEYFFHPRLVFRCGWQTLPSSESLGFALLLNHLSIDFGLQTHPLLGNSFAIAISLPL
jgi:hypothetical protein